MTKKLSITRAPVIDTDDSSSNSDEEVVNNPKAFTKVSDDSSSNSDEEIASNFTKSLMVHLLAVMKKLLISHNPLQECPITYLLAVMEKLLLTQKHLLWI